ncbi:MAG: Fe-S cluster assembly protein HesB [Planctomycetota bacterium]
MTSRTRKRLILPQPFELRLVVESHGWFDLPPFCWQRDRGTLRTAWSVAGEPLAVEISAAANRLLVTMTSAQALAPGVASGVVATVEQMLSLDQELAEFHAQARDQDAFSWVAERGAGRMLKSPTAFEDMVKVLLTTNCSWSLTVAMVKRLVDELGSEAPLGLRAFPTPQVMAERDERYYRERVRVGYRARALVELARRVASGELAPESWRDPGCARGLVEERISSLLGFGPYAKGGLLRLLGHHDELALDSWCRAQYARRYHGGRRVSDGTIARRYASFGRYRGLALWLDLTRDWHLPSR